MAWRNQIVCDVCGTPKQPSNHWWFAEVTTVDNGIYSGFSVYPWSTEAERKGPRRACLSQYIHLCGQACAIRKLNEFMAGAPTEHLHIADPEQAEVSSTQESATQPQWTAGGPITEPE
jgi:hypothetical protein